MNCSKAMIRPLGKSRLQAELVKIFDELGKEFVDKQPRNRCTFIAIDDLKGGK